MQSSFVGEKKKFSQDLKHSHHRVVRTSSSSRAVTQYSLRLLLARRKFGKSSSRCETTKSVSVSEPKLKKRRSHVRDMYNINVQLEKKTSEKRTKKQPKVKNSFICAFKKTQALFTQKRRERATQLFYQQHTHKDNNNNNKNEKSDDFITAE